MNDVGIVAEAHDARFLNVLGEELLWPQDAVSLPCFLAMATQAVDEDDARSWLNSMSD